ncbi:hypothetical protein ACI3EQ_06965 [Ornithinimicrobium sp. LYQ103]
MDPGLVLDGAHPHGWVLRARGSGAAPPAVPEDVVGWRTDTASVPSAVLHLHPRTVLSRGRSDAGTVLLLGHPVDVAAGSADGAGTAAGLARTWTSSGDDALVREAAELGGRWTLLAVRHRPDLLVVPDAHATQPVFHATTGGRVVLASSASLVAAGLGLPVDDDALRLLEDLRARRRGAVTYLPGRRTAYQDVHPLLPNCLLRVQLGDPGGTPAAVHHERFWPWRQRVGSTDVDAVYDAFRDRLGRHVELLAGLGRPAVSLTAGGDSRATAAVARRALRERDGFAFTYVNPRDARNGPSAMADVAGASAVAARLGIPHRVLRWRQPPVGGTFDVLHRRTYAPLVPSRGAAHAMWADLPPDLVQLQSNCAETGTTFIRRRTPEPLSPLRLSRMMMHATDGLEDLAERMYGGYVEQAQLTPDRLLGYDHHDLFYWEQRIGRWGWQKFVDGDLGHRILLPFNDRVLLETMLSLPYPQREAKVLLERLFDEVPEARLPPRSEPRARRTAHALVGGLPGPVAGRLAQVVRRQERRADLARLTWPRGYAVLPVAGTPSSSPGVGRTPRGWASVALPGGRAALHLHPSLARAVAGAGDTWVLVLGEPVDVGAGAVGAREVAGGLHALLTARPEEAAAAAAALAGSWLVVLRSPGRTLVLTDPLVSLGLHRVEDGAALVSHGTLATATSPAPVTGAEVLRGTEPPGEGPLRPVPLDELVDLASVSPCGVTRAARLARHAELLRGRGRAWLGLDAGAGSRELLELLAAQGVSTFTWWDREGDDRQADPVFEASLLASAAGVPHRVLGLREDVDGSSREPARTARALARDALSTTWGRDDLPLPVGDALAQALPPDAVVWLGAVPGPPAAAPRSWDLVQGVRPVALPFSDRVLPLLPSD